MSGNANQKCVLWSHSLMYLFPQNIKQQINNITVSLLSMREFRAKCVFHALHESVLNYLDAEKLFI